MVKYVRQAKYVTKSTAAARSFLLRVNQEQQQLQWPGDTLSYTWPLCSFIVHRCSSRRSPPPGRSAPTLSSCYD